MKKPVRQAELRMAAPSKGAKKKMPTVRGKRRTAASKLPAKRK